MDPSALRKGRILSSPCGRPPGPARGCRDRTRAAGPSGGCRGSSEIGERELRRLSRYRGGLGARGRRLLPRLVPVLVALHVEARHLAGGNAQGTRIFAEESPHENRRRQIGETLLLERLKMRGADLGLLGDRLERQVKLLALLSELRAALRHGSRPRGPRGGGPGQLGLRPPRLTIPLARGR